MANEQRLIEIPADGIVRIPIMQGDSTVGERRIDLSYIPTVDAVEVVHGRWIQHGELDDDGNGQYHCSVCSAGEKHNPMVDVPYCWREAQSDGGCSVLLEMRRKDGWRKERWRMKTVMLANTVIMSTYAVCVTYAAIHFDNPGILWWYLLLTMMGFSYSRKEDDDNA